MRLFSHNLNSETQKLIASRFRVLPIRSTWRELSLRHLLHFSPGALQQWQNYPRLSCKEKKKLNHRQRHTCIPPLHSRAAWAERTPPAVWRNCKLLVCATSAWAQVISLVGWCAFRGTGVTHKDPSVPGDRREAWRLDFLRIDGNDYCLTA